MDDDLSTIDKAQSDLNNGKYQDAIVKLEDFHQKNPGDAQGSLLLATAYAGSVGINLVDSYDFFSTLLSSDKDSGRKPIGGGGGQPKADDPSHTLVVLARKIQGFVQEISNQGNIFFAIPFKEGGDRKRLDEALALTGQVPEADPLYPRVRTYQTFLHILQFSNHFKEMFPGVDFNKMPGGIELICSIQAAALAKNFDLALVYFNKLVDDLEWISLNKKASLGKQATRLKELSRFLSGKVSSSNLNEAQAILGVLQADYCT